MMQMQMHGNAERDPHSGALVFRSSPPDRIARLERRVSDLEQRIKQLEQAAQQQGGVA